MRAVVFDLDNTLYDESTYVESGFRHVSSFLGDRFSLPVNEVYQDMIYFLDKDGRGAVFNNVLKKYDLLDELLIKTLVFLYRNHTPIIRMPVEAVAILKEVRSKGLKLGIITDGDSTLQLRKIHALGIKDYVDQIIHTDIFGKESAKPCHTPFQVMMNLLQVGPKDMCYVGDRISKDINPAFELGITPILFTQYFDDRSAIVDVKKAKSHVELQGLLRSMY